jgi:hypothetical protein
VSDSINRLIVRQREIASVIRSWLEWDTGNRAKHGLTVEGNTHIMALPVPVWPTHSQFVCWIEVCEDAADALAKIKETRDAE